MNLSRSIHKKDVTLYDIDKSKFWSFVEKGGANECWQWKRAKNTSGYGLFHVRALPHDYEANGRTYTQLVAHRVAYYLVNSCLLPHQYGWHTCDNTLCCNPSQLWLGSQQDNVNDMIEKGRGYWQ